MMELRKKFEQGLKNFLTEKFFEGNHVKVLKNEIVLSLEKGNGRIGFRFLNAAQGYNLSQSATVPELKNYIKEFSPTYKANFMTDFELVMNSSMEYHYRQFSPTGVIALPRNEKERLKAYKLIFTKINEIYLPRLTNLITARKEVIDDVLRFPRYYKYPFLTILYIIKENHLSKEDIDVNAILSKRISANHSNDKDLLEEVLKNSDVLRKGAGK